ncbi:MAG TPA: globin domain-containing protein [Ktedonobacteraceae bacterium]|nr:globin domain-containing protein [Ktedonobacteraceae bacterium]
MTVQGELLESSFQAVVLHGEAFVTAFYERLFTRFPETRALFAATDMFLQRKKLQQSLALIVEHMQHPEVLGDMLKGLGQRHVAYGVRPEHYPLVGAVLLETFADFLGKHWTQAHHDAWVKGFEAVCSLMVQGAQEPPMA